MLLFDKYLDARNKLLKYFKCDTMFNGVTPIYTATDYYWRILGDKVYAGGDVEDTMNVLDAPRIDTAFKDNISNQWIFRGADYTLLHLASGNGGVFEIYSNALELK